MDTTTAAGRLQALANPARLRIYEILSQAGDEGLTVGSVQDLVGINASTLSHHLKTLVLAGLVTQTRAATSLICRPNHDMMDGLFSYLARECRPASKPQGRLTRQADLRHSEDSEHLPTALSRKINRRSENAQHRP